MLSKLFPCIFASQLRFLLKNLESHGLEISVAGISNVLAVRVRTSKVFVLHLHQGERPAGVEDSKAQNRQSNHCAIQNNEIDLVLHYGRFPPVAQLRNTICAPRKDG